MIDQLAQQTYVLALNDIRPQSISTYNSYLNSYSTTLKQLGFQGDPIPPTDITMGAFIQWGVSIRSPSFSFATIKLFVASFAYYFHLNDLIDLTKTQQFVRYIKSLKLQLGISHPNAKSPVTPKMLESIAKNTDKKISIRSSILPFLPLCITVF